MKRLLSMLIVLLMVFTLVACGGETASTDTVTGNGGTDAPVVSGDTGSHPRWSLLAFPP